jgi:uncharacterized protein (DUF1501 family)
MKNASDLTRRHFLTQGLGLVGVSAAVPNFLLESALAGPKAQSGQPILVVIQLAGGHDGLSAVVPFSNAEYYKNRPKTGIAKNEVLKINDQLGFSPHLAGFKELHDNGNLSVVQGIGYPNPNRSHFTSMDIWHLADRSRRETLGWLGRYADVCHPKNPDPKIAMAVRMTKSPLAIRGAIHPGVSFKDAASFRYTADRGNEKRKQLYTALNKMTPAGSNDAFNFVSHTANNANEASDKVRQLAGTYKTDIAYPDTKLASSLKTVSALIAGGLNTRIYYVSQGGFDTHAGQKERHAQLMNELGGAVLAFQKDLARQGNDKRVLSMAFSEFGRRVKENGSAGCDHGKAGPLFLIGPGVNPGIHGDHPSLTELDQGDLIHQIDFRSVYGEVLDKWLHAPSAKILGENFPAINCLG